MKNPKSYDDYKQEKRESQNRFYASLFASREDGSFSVDKACAQSNLIVPSRRPQFNMPNIPSFD